MSEDSAHISITAAHNKTMMENVTNNPVGGYSIGESDVVIISLNYSVTAMVAVSVVLFVVIVATAFGNLLVCIALARYKQLRTVSNFLIGNLALSDFLLAVTILPLSTVQECLGYWVFGRIVCNFWLCTDVLYCTASIWNLCIIAFDRYTATLYPVWYREKRSTAQAVIYVTIVWVFSFAICIPPLLGWNDLSQNFGINNETGLYQCTLFQTPSYVMFSAAGSFFIPFLITAFLYVRIFFVLRQRMRLMQGATSHHAEAMKKQRTLQQANSDVYDRDELQSITMTPSPMTPLKFNGTEKANNGKRMSLDVIESEMGNYSGNEDSSSDLRSDSIHQQLHHTSVGKKQQATKDGSAREKTKKGNENRTTSKSSRQAKNAAAGGNGGATTVDCVEYIEILVTDENGKDNMAEKNITVAKSAKVSKVVALVDDEKQTAKRISLKVRRLSNPLRRKKSSRKRRQQKSRYEQREMRATIRMAIIIAFFCGMWLGFFVTYVIRGLCPDSCPVPRELDALFFWLGYANSTINPILYTIFNDDFRRAFQKILGCYSKNSQANVMSMKRLKRR